jgi:hypothetical protein
MYRTGCANLPLHGGKAPSWLTGRMRRLAKEICSILIDEYGTDLFLTRVSDPFWFQAFGCVLGYDWHSSGVTTVVTGILKMTLSPEEHGIAVCGGKGKTSRKTLSEIEILAEKFCFSEEQAKTLAYSSRMVAKVDNAAIQAGYPLYHHAFLVNDVGKWAVIQQGMSDQARSARRYHWLSDTTTSFTIEPHNAIVGDIKHSSVLNMTAKESEGARKVSVDLSKEPPQKLKRLAQSITAPSEKNQMTLQSWLPTADVHMQVDVLNMPRNINWDSLAETYDNRPRNYEDLLARRGVGPATVRGLALIAELIYGEKPSWTDPVKYSFAYGGKDGVPYPVNRQSMDESIEILKETVHASRIGDKDKARALQGLRRFVPLDTKNY